MPPQEQRSRQRAAGQSAINDDPALGHIGHGGERRAEIEAAVGMVLGKLLRPIFGHVKNPRAAEAADEQPNRQRIHDLRIDAAPLRSIHAQSHRRDQGDQQHHSVTADRQPEHLIDARRQMLDLLQVRQQKPNRHADQAKQRHIAQRFLAEPMPPNLIRQCQHAGDGPHGQQQPPTKNRQAEETVGDVEKSLQHSGPVWT